MLYASEPQIRVGIMSADSVQFRLLGCYECSVRDASVPVSDGTMTVSHEWLMSHGCGDDNMPQITFCPTHENDSFELMDVMIGIGFHWQRSETQRFRGQLILKAIDGRVWAINTVGLETYLFCVIASEMKATSSVELLKAHAVVSRSWLLAQLGDRQASIKTPTYRPLTGQEMLKWYDREDHEHFDVCADDHCQRYQGLTRADNDVVRQAIAETRAEILTSDGHVCDARFSKCCGGVSEKFSTCWQPIDYAYLMPVLDTDADVAMPDLTDHAEAQKWIETSPEAFCNTQDPDILQQVLNHYDRETTPDFYRWQVSYTARELTDIVERKSGLRFGLITDMVPLQRGPSGRIISMRIEGTERNIVVGKELEIRRWLSESHLYSSAFVVEKEGDKFTLKGAGWGHGVGMCQIGAAVMSHRGYDYKQIVKHYFRDSTLEKGWSL